jgi:hypothetical protein
MISSSAAYEYILMLAGAVVIVAVVFTAVAVAASRHPRKDRLLLFAALFSFFRR